MKKMFSVLLLITVLLFAFTQSAFAQTTFSDMPDDYSTTALQYAVEKEYLLGMDGKIMPNDSITYAQVAAVLARVANLEEMSDLSAYSDVSSDDWFYEDMAKAVAKGLFMMDGDMLYPNLEVSRENAFRALAIALDLSADDSSSLDAFSDKDLLAEDNMLLISALVENGIVLGYDNMLGLEQDIKRKDFAVILYRAMMLMEDDGAMEVSFMASVTHSFTGEEIMYNEVVAVNKGEAVAMPETPANTVVIDGIDIDKWYDFRGWYTEAELINKWDFASPIEQDLVLYGEYVHIPDPPTNTHFSMINEMFVDSEGITMVKGIEDGHEYGPMPLAADLTIDTYMADPDSDVAGTYLAYTIGDRQVAAAEPVVATASGLVTEISSDGVAIDDGEMVMFDEQIYMYWAHADGTYSVYNKVAGRFPVEEMTEEHLPLGTFVSLFDARSGSDLFAEGKIDAIIVRMSDDDMDVADKVFTLEELAMYNGQDGMAAYIALNGVVYDVSAVPQWMEGMHGQQMAGTDITEAFTTVGHNDDRYKELPVVGTLAE